MLAGLIDRGQCVCLLRRLSPHSNLRSGLQVLFVAGLVSVATPFIGPPRNIGADIARTSHAEPLLAVLRSNAWPCIPCLHAEELLAIVQR